MSQAHAAADAAALIGLVAEHHPVWVIPKKGMGGGHVVSRFRKPLHNRPSADQKESVLAFREMQWGRALFFSGAERDQSPLDTFRTPDKKGGKM